MRLKVGNRITQVYIRPKGGTFELHKLVTSFPSDLPPMSRPLWSQVSYAYVTSMEDPSLDDAFIANFFYSIWNHPNEVQRDLILSNKFYFTLKSGHLKEFQ